VHPRAILCLGATAAKALLGASFRVSTARGKFIPSELASIVTATVHPSSILREPDPVARGVAMKAFVRDLARLARKLKT
jgi:DNA polymerase